MTLRSWCCCAAGLALAAAGPALGQRGAIRGKITDPDGNVLCFGEDAEAAS